MSTPNKDWFNPPTPPRPDDPREAVIWDDVFGKGETDQEYFERRLREHNPDGPRAYAPNPKKEGGE